MLMYECKAKKERISLRKKQRYQGFSEYICNHCIDQV